ncbi:hypothetical protein G6F65_021809 [Rhizopus arrhizus]|nr:hypothetical protein G6F65_021809 [Rhizopus arrhizus]
MPVDFDAVERIVRIVILRPRGCDGPCVARILRAFMRVHEIGHVPGFLVAQHAGLAQRHVGLDEAGGVADLMHARAPVERVGAPQCRKHPVLAVLLALAVCAVADRAILAVHLAAAHVIGLLGRRRQLAITLAFEHHAGGRLAGQPEHVALQRRQRVRPAY